MDQFVPSPAAPPAAAPAATAATAPTPGTLQGSLEHMLDRTPEECTNHCKAIYTLAPDVLATAWASANNELVVNGNARGYGPFMYIVNSGNSLQIAHSIAKVPTDLGIASRSAFNGKYVVCLGDREDKEDHAIYKAADPTDIFERQKGKLASFQQATATEPPDDEEMLEAYAQAPEQEFLPVLPLFGREVCQLAIDGIYNSDRAKVWTWAEIPYKLKPYIESITDPDIRAKMELSIMAMVTRQQGSRSTIVGNILQKNHSTPAQLEPWILKHMNQVLDPLPAYSPPTVDNNDRPPGTVDNNDRPPGTVENNDRPPGTVENNDRPPGTVGNDQHADDTGNDRFAGANANNRFPSTGNDRFAGANANNHFPNPGIWPPANSEQPPQRWPHSGHTRVHWAPDMELEHRSNRPRPDLALGVDSWNDTRLYALMGHLKVESPDDIPQIWIDFVGQPKHSRHLWYKANVTARLKEMEPLGFAQLELLPQAIDDQAELKLTQSTDTHTWHRCITGWLMLRNPEEVRHWNRLNEGLHSSNIQFSLAPGDIHKLHAQAPLPVTEMHELLMLLKRISLFTSFMVIGSELGRLASGYLHGLTANGAYIQLAKDSEWMRLKPNEIIVNLLNVEKEEMKVVLTKADFEGPTPPPFYHCHNLDQLVAAGLSPSPSIATSQFPRDLIPRAPSVTPSYQQQAPQRDTNSNGARGGGNRRQNDQRQRSDPRRPPQQQQAGAGPNSQFPSALKTFWDTVPAHRRNQPMAHMLRAANTSTVACLQQLGLTEQDCGKFHLRGACNNPNCSRSHRQYTPPAGGVDLVIVKLREGFQLTS